MNRKGVEVMELKEAIEQLKDLREDRKSFVQNDELADEIFLKDIEAIETVLQELDRLQKENDLAKKALIANSYEADERNNLLAEVQRLKKENEKYYVSSTGKVFTLPGFKEELYEYYRKRIKIESEDKQ